jgi:glutamyl-tRNA synthetase
MTQVRTRIAPSPTGMLHLGTARTALFCWAYARHFGGKFILRIEDTDLERSTEEAVQVILDSMRWLGLDYDEGPVRQTHRLQRYGQAIEQLIADGKAYKCYASKDELETLREAQMARGEKPRYDGRWRPENAQGRVPPAGVTPVVRFRNPDAGEVAWNDLVKGPISIANSELDDLVIARGADLVPTYNFAVVVDDWDMRISHVFRGDEHINNTPWQINLFRALGLEPPLFGHHPIILGEDGLKLSKRRGAVSVTAYEEMGYLPEAMLNYLARLGWSHGDDELFTREQMVRWFDGSHLARSPAQWDPAKLAWVNAHYLKQADDGRLAVLVQEQLARRGVQAEDLDHLRRACALFKDRCTTTVELADWLQMYFRPVTPHEADLAAHVGDAARPAIRALREQFTTLEWSAPAIAAAMKAALAAHGLKMPQLAPALRVLVCGRTQTPSIDAVLALFSRERVLERLSSV